MTRITSWSCLLALCLAQLQWFLCVSAEEEKSTCLKSLNPIYEAEKRVRNDAVVRRYVLCENTEFYVALNFGEDGVPLDGQYPIPVGRPNIHVFCGEDGKSENNCQLVRGLVHVGVVDEFGSNTRADNILLQGLTFFRATSVNVIAMIGGDITLRDCVFKRNRNVASIYAVSPQTGSARRKLSLISNDEDDGLTNYLHQRTDRSLQFSSMNMTDDDESTSNSTEPFFTTITRTDLQIIIIDSVFSDNVLGASPGADSTAIIYSVGASIDMRNSVIVGTTKDVQKDEELPHMIYVKSAPLALDSNCFIGNDEAITPVIVQQPTNDVQARLNFNQRTTSFLPKTNCDFVATNSSTTASINSDTFVCTGSDSDVCQAKATADYRYPCVSYLDDIYFSEWDVDNSDVPRTYILCPRSTFKVGSRHDSDGTPQGGSYPIILGHSNIRVLCGVDGRLENGCDVVNGVVQIAHFDEFQTGGRPIVNTLVQGISFSKASAINALVSGSGDVVIRDCVFKNNANVAAVYAQVLNPKRRGRKLAFLLPELVEDSSRGLLSSWRQDYSDESLVTQIDSCVFTNNTIGSAVNPVSGLITNDNATMTILNSMIVNTVNAASKEDLGYFEVGYLIGNMNGETRLAKNCFYDNEVTIAPVLNQGRLQAMFNAGRQAMAPRIADSASQSTSRAGNFAEDEALSATEPNTPSHSSSTNSTWSPPIDHANARCEFVATVKGPDNVLGSVNPELVEFDCLPFDSETCYHPDAPTGFPTMSPTISPMPTSTPASAPTPRQSESSGKPSFGAVGHSGLLFVSIAVMLLV